MPLQSLRYSLRYPSDLGSATNKEAHYVTFISKTNKPGTIANRAQISMYLPASALRTSYSAKYTDQAGIVDDVASSVFSAVGDNPSLLAQTEGVVDVFKSLGFGGTVGRLLAQSLSKADLGKRVLSGAKIALNPKIGLMFDGSGDFRVHKFDFNLIARSKPESDSITKIILAFKKAMLPSITSIGAGNVSNINAIQNLSQNYDSSIDKQDFGSNFLNYPDTFAIEFGHTTGDTNNIPFKIQESVLTNMDVNYSGSDIPVFFKDTNDPMNIQLSLSFTELFILTRDKIDQGF